MSSFVIDKKEYIKASGLISGLSEALGLWLYSYKVNRNMTPEDLHKQFTEFFNMNCLSFQEQYREDEAYTDSNEYRAEFEEYKRRGYSIGVTEENLKQTIAELRSFFNSCIYQTEKESYMFAMQMFFDNVLNQLIPYLIPGIQTESWGTLEIPEARTITRIL